MARIFITGSADGLGLSAARLLVEQGHSVVLHARSGARAEDARAALPEAEAVVIGDLSTIAAMREVAEQANARGSFDAVVHNVALGYREPRRVETVDGLSQLWAVNVLAPYVLTALMHRPDRLVYLSSGMHLMGDPSLADPQWSARRWNGSQAYSDSKLHDVLIGFGVARRWPDVPTNMVNPGWVPTVMGGPGAPDDLDQAHRTQAWLAVGADEGARRTGRFLYHRRPAELHPAARDTELQDRLLDHCRAVSGVTMSGTGKVVSRTG
ncbi:MAG: SDR family NAD(P)-dependent oxidoreductase [Pseudonocardia sp.]|nr:SDR family NAD(P)-dependent oxidoreductase [Pseudonocardia sp.]